MRVTKMRIQCGRKQRAFNAHLMRVVALVWTGLLSKESVCKETDVREKINHQATVR